MQFVRLTVPALLATAAVAQTVIVPSAAATTRPTPLAYNSNVFYGSSSQPPDSHVQLIYDVSDIPVQSAGWGSMQVRRPVGLGNSNPAMTTTATIIMSIAPNPSSGATTVFATNHGPLQITVFNGQISLPAETNPSAWPAPWQAPIPFGAPFPYVSAAGQSVVVDIVQTGNTGGSTWYLEATGRDLGSRTSNPRAQSSCRFSNGNYSNSLSYRKPYIGGSWYVQYSNLLPNAPGIGALGFQGAGGTWAGMPLPVDLAPYGAPGCEWSVDVQAYLPLTSDANGRARWPSFTMPINPAAAGLSFFDHAFFIDPPANAFGLVTTWSSEWTIGTGLGAPGATVYATGTRANGPTGTLRPMEVATLMFN